MRTIWKWILGVLLVLLVVGALGAAAFLWRGRMGEVSYRGMPFHQSWQNGPMMRGDGFGPRDGGPMMHGYRHFRPFGGIFALGGGLFRLIVLGALLYGAYWLGRRNARIVLEPKPTPAAEPPPAPREETIPPAPTE